MVDATQTTNLPESKPHLTAERLRELLHYDPETGVWHWRISAKKGHRKAGEIAGGRKTSGYWRIGIDGRRYFGHILAVLYMTGRWPIEEVDHKDGIPGHDWWDNLREATHQQNMLNRKRQSNNTSGFRGVCWSAQQRKWMARLNIGGKRFHLGFFDSPEEAAVVVSREAPRIHGEFARAS